MKKLGESQHLQKHAHIKEKDFLYFMWSNRQS